MIHSLIQAGVRSFLVLWASGMVLVGSTLMVSHWVSLPHPETSDQVWAKQLADLRAPESVDQWTAYHFLYSECPCSVRVLNRVLNSPPHPDAAERIVLIGEDPTLAAKAISQGYELDVITPEQLMEKYGCESAPFMVVLDPAGVPHYSGGYTSRKQGFDIKHREIISDLIAGKPVESLPLYGCAVSDTLKSIVDPLGLKYD